MTRVSLTEEQSGKRRETCSPGNTSYGTKTPRFIVYRIQRQFIFLTSNYYRVIHMLTCRKPPAYLIMKRDTDYAHTYVYTPVSLA